jgi:hypothetical protein
MRKILFMTDFVRTLTSDNLNKKEYEDNVKKLIQSLTTIKKIHKAGDIIFSISTNMNDYSYIKSFLNTIKSLSGFEIGKIFLRDKIIDGVEETDNPFYYKEDQLIDYIKTLKVSTEIAWIGFADDRHAETVDKELKEANLNIPYNTFKPGHNGNTSTLYTSELIGIEGLNKALDLYIKKGTIN